jgi:membrane protein DedA with SNARE-associated domain
VARMPFWRFTLLTTAGCVPWIFMLTFIGREVGDRWESWKDSLHYVDYAVVALIVLGLLYLVIRNRRGKPEKPEAAGEPAADASR